MPAGSAQTFDARTPFWKPTVLVAPPSNGVITNLAFSTIVGMPNTPFSIVVRRAGQDPVLMPSITAEVIRVTATTVGGVVTAGSRNYAGSGSLTILPGDEVYQYIGETLDEFNNIFAGSKWLSSSNPATTAPIYSFDEGVGGPFAWRRLTTLGPGATNSAGDVTDMQVLAASGSGLTAAQAGRDSVQALNLYTETSARLSFIDFEQLGNYFDAGGGGPNGEALYAIARGNSVKSLGAVAFTAATPTVVTKVAHGLMPGTEVAFQAAVLPGGIHAGIQPGPTDWNGTYDIDPTPPNYPFIYYVSKTNWTANSFQITRYPDFNGAAGTFADVGASTVGTTVTATASQDDWTFGKSYGMRINQEAAFRPATGLLVSGTGHEALGWMLGISNTHYRSGGYSAFTSPVWKADDAIPFLSAHLEDLAGADAQIAMLNSRTFGATGDTLEWLIGGDAWNQFLAAPDLTKINGAQKWRAYAAGSLELVTTLILGGFNGRTNEVRTLRADGTFVGKQTALATNAIVGHMYIPTCAGIPTGVPTAFTGQAALIMDSTNHKVYAADAAGWVALN